MADRKRCRCSPSCYKILGQEARRRHYRKADERYILASDYGSDVEMTVHTNAINSDPDDDHSDSSIPIDPPIQNNPIPNNSGSGSVRSSGYGEDESDESGDSISESDMVQGIYQFKLFDTHRN
jgi:hypothetical protein